MRVNPLTSGSDVQVSERVAQAVEHVTFNHGVVGSSPTALTNLITSLSGPETWVTGRT